MLVVALISASSIGCQVRTTLLVRTRKVTITTVISYFGIPFKSQARLRLSTSLVSVLPKPHSCLLKQKIYFCSLYFLLHAQKLDDKFKYISMHDQNDNEDTCDTQTAGWAVQFFLVQYCASALKRWIWNWCHHA